MAPYSSTKQLPCLLLLFTAVISSIAKTAPEWKETNLTLYFHDQPGGVGSTPGPNATAVPITGIPGRVWNYQSFGTVFCTDDLITEGPSEDSTHIGRGQGIYVTSALDGSYLTILLSIVFKGSAKYNGSTIQLQGADEQLAAVREVAVVGGTGKFRNARGFAIFQTVFLDPVTFYGVFRCDVTVQH